MKRQTDRVTTGDENGKELAESTKQNKERISRPIEEILANPGMLSLLCGAGNFSKMWPACNMEFNTKNKESISICTIICTTLPMYFSVQYVQ
jgi:hypothetical protein